MVSKNRQNHYSISIPADWGLPKFHLGQRIQTLTLLPNTTRIQTGEISGIEYIKSDSVWVTQHGMKPGSYYTNFINPYYEGCSGSPLNKGGWGGRCIALFYEISITPLKSILTTLGTLLPQSSALKNQTSL